MTPPIVSPRAEKIAENLLEDARAFLAEKGAELASRQVEALARAVARHLAALEELLLCGEPQRGEVLRAGTAIGPLSAQLCDAALGPVEPPSPSRMLIVQRWDREASENVAEEAIRWGLGGRPTMQWWMVENARQPFSCALPHVCESPNSPWGVRVEILGEGR